MLETGNLLDHFLALHAQTSGVKPRFLAPERKLSKTSLHPRSILVATRSHGGWRPRGCSGAALTSAVAFHSELVSLTTSVKARAGKNETAFTKAPLSPRHGSLPWMGLVVNRDVIIMYSVCEMERLSFYCFICLRV